MRVVIGRIQRRSKNDFRILEPIFFERSLSIHFWITISAQSSSQSDDSRYGRDMILTLTEYTLNIRG